MVNLCALRHSCGAKHTRIQAAQSMEELTSVLMAQECVITTASPLAQRQESLLQFISFPNWQHSKETSGILTGIDVFVIIYYLNESSLHLCGDY